MYLKADIKFQPSIILSRLFEDLMEIRFDEAEIKHTTSVMWGTNDNDLCFDIYSEITELKMIITATLRFV